MNEANQPVPTEPEEEKDETAITDAGHLIEPESEDHEEVAAPVGQEASVVPEPPETPVKQIDVSPAPPAPVDESSHTSGGVLVLQWLSYAFWFWFSISMSWLATVVINYYVSGSESYQWSSALAYPLASVIILLAIALVTDIFYTRHEPAKKTGAANIIMLLHVVPFVLISIGSLVTAVFALITMVLNSDPIASFDGPLITMTVALIVAGLFALIAARAFYGGKAQVRLVARAIFTVLAVGFIVAGFAGPAADALRTKNDRLIEQALPSLASNIREYTSTNDKLPQKLTDVTHTDSYSSDAVQKLIDSNLVTYKPNTVKSSDSSYSPGDGEVSIDSCIGSSYSSDCSTNGGTRYYYQLCTTYKNEKKNSYNYTDDSNYTTSSSAGVAADYRYNYVSSISQHPAGAVCYNLYADGAYDYEKVLPIGATE